SQVVATIVAGMVQLGVQTWMFINIADMCSTKQKDGFMCPNTEVIGTASIVWGVIGPMRMFSPGQLYSALPYWFLIGATCPVIAYMIHLKWPNSIARYVKWVSGCLGRLALCRPKNQLPSQSLRMRLGWITSHILSAALDTGLACAIILIFFVLQYAKSGTIGLSTVQK
ncbi:OPT oligopeptide transporter protein-domain-containing protein, partial [Boletus edulis BED1]